MNYCLSDFVVFVGLGINDYIGVFVVIGGIGEDELVVFYEEKGDDYNVIMVKVVVDWFVEVFVEYLYE